MLAMPESIPAEWLTPGKTLTRWVVSGSDDVKEGLTAA
jgi:hypothetical protein